MVVMERKYGDPVHGCNDADKLPELVHVVGSEPRHKHVVGLLINVAPIRFKGLRNAFTRLHVFSIVFV